MSIDGLFLVRTQAPETTGWSRVYVAAADFQEAASKVATELKVKGMRRYCIIEVARVLQPYIR